MKKMAFIIPPSVEMLDLAGPVQVFTEAKFYGFEVEFEFYSYQEETISTSGLAFGKVANYKEARLKEGDYLFMPGMGFEYVNSAEFRGEREFFKWIKECADKKVFICSICNGAFALGEAGLL